MRQIVLRVLNETAVRLMGFKNPIGQEIDEPYDHKRFMWSGW